MIPMCPAPRAPSRPKIPLPAGACDTHAHVFGPAARFPYAADRSYTPPDAPLEAISACSTRWALPAGFWCRAARTVPTIRPCSTRWRGSPIGCAASRSPTKTCRRRSCGAGTSSACAGCASTISSAAGSCIIAAACRSSAARKLAPAMKELGWHLQLWIDVKDLPDTVAELKSLDLPVVIDHMGRSDASAGTATAGFASLLRLARRGGCWVKLSGAHRISRRAPDYPDARMFHEALVCRKSRPAGVGRRLAASAHGRRDAGRRSPARSVLRVDAGCRDRRRILVTNPQRLYGFPD